MAAISFDTLKFANRLKEAGVPDRQAEAEAEVLAEALQVNLKDLATKSDLFAVRDELKRDVSTLRDEFKSDLRDLDTRTRGRFDALEAKMEGRFLLLQWMLGLVMGGVLVLILKAFF